MPRNASYERQWAECMVRSAGRAPDLDSVQVFLDEVRQRLDKGRDEYGDSWEDRPIRELFREVREEAADIPAWATLLAQRVHAEDLETDALIEIQQEIIRAAASALLCHESLARAAQAFRTASAESKWLASTA